MRTPLWQDTASGRCGISAPGGRIYCSMACAMPGAVPIFCQWPTAGSTKVGGGCRRPVCRTWPSPRGMMARVCPEWRGNPVSRPIGAHRAQIQKIPEPLDARTMPGPPYGVRPGKIGVYFLRRCQADGPHLSGVDAVATRSNRVMLNAYRSGETTRGSPSPAAPGDGQRAAGEVVEPPPGPSPGGDSPVESRVNVFLRQILLNYLRTCVGML